MEKEQSFKIPVDEQIETLEQAAADARKPSFRQTLIGVFVGGGVFGSAGGLIPGILGAAGIGGLGYLLDRDDNGKAKKAAEGLERTAKAMRGYQEESQKLKADLEELERSRNT